MVRKEGQRERFEKFKNKKLRNVAIRNAQSSLEEYNYG